jgi:hypothetical protein
LCRSERAYVYDSAAEMNKNELRATFLVIRRAWQTFENVIRLSLVASSAARNFPLFTRAERAQIPVDQRQRCEKRCLSILTLPTVDTSRTPIRRSRAGGTGGGDLARAPLKSVLKCASSSPEECLLRRCGDDRFNFCAAL